MVVNFLMWVLGTKSGSSEELFCFLTTVSPPPPPPEPYHYMLILCLVTAEILLTLLGFLCFGGHCHYRVGRRRERESVSFASFLRDASCGFSILVTPLKI